MSEGDLNSKVITIIRNKFCYLKNNLEANDIVDFLFQEKVITLDEKEMIAQIEPKSSRNDKLLGILLRARPNQRLEHFFKSLEGKYKDILEHINKQDNINVQRTINNDNSENPNGLSTREEQSTNTNSTQSLEVEYESGYVKQIVQHMENRTQEKSISSVTEAEKPVATRRSMLQQQQSESMLPTRLVDKTVSDLSTSSARKTISEITTVIPGPSSNKTEIVPILQLPSQIETGKMRQVSSETENIFQSPSEVKAVNVLPISYEVETLTVLPALSEEQQGIRLPASSEVKGVVSVFSATSSRSNREIAPVRPTRINNASVGINNLSTTNVTKSMKTMPPVIIDEGSNLELSSMTTYSTLPPSRLTHENKLLPLGADGCEPENNYFETTQSTDGDKYNIAKSMYQKTSQDIDLLMIGKTGNGKSALGNSLLRKVAFESKVSTTSVTKNVTYEVTEFNGRKIKVVDSPGVGDTDWTDDATEQLVSEAMAEAISINPRGYHAFLLVVRFGGRFTKEDKGTVDYLKKMFGSNFVKRYCILVMTHGDLFQQDVEDVSFEEWLDEEQGVVAELVNECDHRVLLFDNKTKDEAKIQKQLNELIHMVDTLTNENSRYNNHQFELAQSEIEKFIVNSKKPIITEETMAEANIILQNYRSLQDKILDDCSTTLLEELLERANRLNDNLIRNDDRFGNLEDLIDQVQSTKMSIMDEIKLCCLLAENIDKNKQERKEILNKEMKPWSDMSDRVVSENIKLFEYKASMFMAEIDKYKENLLEKTKQLEDSYISLKRKNLQLQLFKAIKKKVAKTFKLHNKVNPFDFL